MTVLLLSPFFFPEKISTGKYNTYVAEELVRQGTDVTVFASHPLYPQWRPERTEATLSGITIKRGGNWLWYPRSAMLRRAVLELWFTWHVLSRFASLNEKPSRVVSIFPPSLFFLLLFSFLPRGCRTIGIVHDLQGVYAGRTRGLLNGLVQTAIHFVERRCFDSCDRLIFLSSSMANRAIAEYALDSAKCVVGYPFVALPGAEEQREEALARVLSSQYINVVYSGALGDKQNPDGLFRFLDLLARSRTDVRCHIFSAGPHFERLHEIHALSSGCKVEFHDLVPAEQLDELYARSDVQLIPQSFGTAEGSLPSKLPNLMAAGVPVFAICEEGSELADLVLKADAGGVAASWNPSVLVERFVELIPMLKAETHAMRRERLRAFVEANFSIRVVVEQILRD